MPDITNLQLGRLPVKEDPRTLRAAAYLGAVSPPPVASDWQGSVPSWPMYANDRLGDCTIAAAGHLVGEWSFDATTQEGLLTDDQVIAAYSAVSGYDPRTGANDNGAVELDVLNYWRKTGVGGHKIAAFAALDVKNHDQVKQAIAIFGGVYIGVALPKSAQAQVHSIWDAESGPDGEAGSWGGHAVPVGQYNDTHLTCVTWGAPQAMTWAFWDAYVEEAYVVLSEDFLSGGKDPQGFDLAALQADLAAIAANKPNPTPPAPTPPPPPPVPDPPAPPPTPGALVVTLTDPKLIGRVERAAARRGMSTDEYVQHRLEVHFSLLGLLGGEVSDDEMSADEAASLDN